MTFHLGLIGIFWTKQLFFWAAAKMGLVGRSKAIALVWERFKGSLQLHWPCLGAWTPMVIGRRGRIRSRGIKKARLAGSSRDLKPEKTRAIYMRVVVRLQRADSLGQIFGRAGQ